MSMPFGSLFAATEHRIRVAIMSPEALVASQRKKDLAAYGPSSPRLICPQCQTRGAVCCKPITQKKGLSGGKVVGALLTGGLSILATGLSRKEAVTQAHCTSCGSTWRF